MRNEDIIKMFSDSLKSNEEYMSRISIGIEKMNDQNILHQKSLDVLTQAIAQNSKIAEVSAGAIQQFLSFNGKIFLLLITAIIILAGVEKIADLL